MDHVRFNLTYYLLSLHKIINIAFAYAQLLY